MTPVPGAPASAAAAASAATAAAAPDPADSAPPPAPDPNGARPLGAPAWMPPAARARLLPLVERAGLLPLVEKIGPTRLVVGASAVVLVLAAFLIPGSAERADPFEGPGAAFDLLLKLGAVLALAYVSLAALRRYTAGTASQRGTLLEVLDSTTLGPNRSVYVVRAGGKRLVLGVTQNQITALGELDESPRPDAHADPATARPVAESQSADAG